MPNNPIPSSYVFNPERDLAAERKRLAALEPLRNREQEKADAETRAKIEAMLGGDGQKV